MLVRHVLMLSVVQQRQQLSTRRHDEKKVAMFSKHVSLPSPARSPGYNIDVQWMNVSAWLVVTCSAASVLECRHGKWERNNGALASIRNIDQRTFPRLWETVRYWFLKTNYSVKSVNVDGHGGAEHSTIATDESKERVHLIWSMFNATNQIENKVR